MLPIAPLMIEHRLIERMIHLIQQELERIQANVAVDPEFAFVDSVFIDTAVDFLRTYADRCHHGKEEDILFPELEQPGVEMHCDPRGQIVAQGKRLEDDVVVAEGTVRARRAKRTAVRICAVTSTSPPPTGRAACTSRRPWPAAGRAR